MEPLSTADGNVDKYSHYGKQYGGSFKNKKQSYHMILLTIPVCTPEGIKGSMQ
jgi:hypothetical protein